MVNGEFFGLLVDGGANAAEKLGALGLCMFLIGLDSTALVGLEDAAREVGTNDGLGLNMLFPDEMGMELGLDTEVGGKVFSGSEIAAGPCVVGTGG